MLQKMMNKDEKGFTLIELMIVIAIIGILAAIAIPNFISYRRRSYNSGANADIKNLYTSAQAYFTDNPAGSTTNLADFKAYGFRQTPDVDVTVVAGTQGNFSADAYHSSGDKTYHVGSDGGIVSSS
jgi:prepilin-type N-terminal cleavage/methylation domain-containing protein